MTNTGWWLMTTERAYALAGGVLGGVLVAGGSIAYYLSVRLVKKAS